MENKFEVYIKVNENNEIVDIGSNLFLPSLEGYIKIDEGYGDKYAHAQGNYLEKPLVDFLTGAYNYKFDGTNILENQ